MFLLLDGRESVEVTLDALGEVVLVGAYELEVRRSALALLPPSFVEAGAGSDTRPFRGDQNANGGGEQRGEHPAHDAIVPGLLRLNIRRGLADRGSVTSSAAFLVPWAMVWVVLIRALLVEAGFMSRACRHCGQPLERRSLGGDICRCC